MAFVEQSHVNDIGTVFRVTVFDTTSTGSTTVADISSATTKKFTFRRPDGSTFERVAVFTNSGSDGKIEYATVDGDLNGPGTWHLQALVTTPDGTHNTSVGYFKVNENL